MSLFYGAINAHLSRRIIIIVAYLTIGIIGILLAVITNIVVLFFAMIWLGITVFLTYPALFSFVSEVTHESVEGLTFGLTFMLQTGGGTIILFTGGFLSDLIGIWSPFVILGTLSLVITGSLILNWRNPLLIPKHCID